VIRSQTLNKDMGKGKQTSKQHHYREVAAQDLKDQNLAKKAGTTAESRAKKRGGESAALLEREKENLRKLGITLNGEAPATTTRHDRR
jgi:hypothetical protein